MNGKIVNYPQNNKNLGNSSPAKIGAYLDLNNSKTEKGSECHKICYKNGSFGNAKKEYVFIEKPLLKLDTSIKEINQNETNELYYFFNSVNFYYKKFTTNKRHAWFEIKWWNKELQSEQISSNKSENESELLNIIEEEAYIKYSNCTYIEMLEKESPDKWVFNASSKMKTIEIKCDKLECNLELTNILFHKDFYKKYDLNLINFCCCKQHILDSLELALNIPEQKIKDLKLSKIKITNSNHEWEVDNALIDQNTNIKKLISKFNDIRK